MNPNYIPVALEELKKRIEQRLLQVGPWEYRRARYLAPHRYEFTTDWQPISPGEAWGEVDTTAFFRASLAVPEAPQGSKLGLKVRMDGEGVLKVDGAYHHGVDRNRTFIPLSQASEGDTLELEIEVVGQFRPYDFSREAADPKRKFVFHGVDLVAVDRQVEKLWYDLSVGRDAAEATELEDVKEALQYAIYCAVVELDLNGGEEAFRESLAKAAAVYQEMLADMDYGRRGGKLHLLGHSHIDVAWLWQLKETVRKCSRTFSTALTLMDEYPHYYFTVSQAQLFEYTKTHYPGIYQRIKEKVAAGQWEPEGSSWVEMDCNIPSGESLVRQFLYGKRFFKDEFGVTTRILWLPDVFGYTASLPQIMKKAGVEYFLTNKIMWNDTNRFPYNLFQWEGIDGTRVLAHIAPSPNYNGSMKPQQLNAQWKNFKPKHLCRDVIYTYGFGDGGGGVTREMLEYAARLQDMPGLPRTKPSKAGDFFAAAEKVRDRLPVWVNELYFELHRGTYTTQARNKRYNRKSEILYREVELWNAVACALRDGHTYPRDLIDSGWKTILLHQFHDILPGSSIGAVYEDSDTAYEAITRSGDKAKESALKVIVSQIDTSSLTTPVVVFNSNSWKMTDVARIDLPAGLKASEVQVKDMAGNVQPSQPTGDGRALIFLAADVPAMGYKTFTLERASAPAGRSPVSQVEKTDKGLAVNTPAYELTLDHHGNITRLFDKAAGREVINPQQPGNEWQAFEDRPAHWDAWDIETQYKDKRLDIVEGTAPVVVENGPVRTVLQLERKVGSSTFRQQIVLYQHSRRIDFINDGNWREKHVLLKVAFPVTVYSPKATYEIAYGALERSTHENTSWEQAQFEVCGHKWADLSEAGYGVSLLNDCKYGYDIKGANMRLSLLRAPTNPDPRADEGEHTFVYALYPHQGSWREGGTVKEAYALNQPMCAIDADTTRGSLPAELSFVASNSPNAVVEVVKLAEDDSCGVVRVFECEGRRGKVTITLPKPVACVEECNLLEESIGESQATSKGNTEFCFELKPFEIKTFKITLA